MIVGSNPVRKIPAGSIPKKNRFEVGPLRGL